MLLKAYIVQLPEDGSNEFQVRIPYFEGNTNREVIYSALLCNQPGEYGGYKVGDCVYVQFEDTRLNVPVIIGKLYVNKEDVDSNHTVNSLNVTGSISLPADTTIGGYSVVDIFKNNQKESVSTGELSNLDYEEICDIVAKLNYEIVDYWPYEEKQEEYCKVSYSVYNVDFEYYNSIYTYMEI